MQSKIAEQLVTTERSYQLEKSVSVGKTVCPADCRAELRLRIAHATSILLRTPYASELFNSWIVDSHAGRGDLLHSAVVNHVIPNNGSS
jgi:hypothetical protein